MLDLHLDGAVDTGISALIDLVLKHREAFSLQGELGKNRNFK